MICKLKTVTAAAAFGLASMLAVANAAEPPEGGTVAAGSVVNKNTEPGTLTVARARQASIGNWQRPKKK